MNKTETKLEGCVILEPKVFGDHRGWFMESYSKNTVESLGLNYDFVQDNHSYSKMKGVLRGIHLQNAPYAQAKLVRCTRGAILDVAVDLREDSKTYKQWISVELSAENQKQLMIPRGFGHAFVTLSDDVEVQYKADNFYDYPSDRSIRYDDPELNIDWGIDNPVLSDKDKAAPFLNDADIKF
ncbi:dTDP-4-dehydrorhamnose 3,5-epimerase [Erysipelothrix larvae]|uniref:dTDP-4-dehydrorhamnose 3,5-epimerase n=1 Tax=Erysipelothrix larvae TaxID=1514105 RepID=A0A0X8H0U7_9FIRM|nr:dTDP-4-dehydrorhamnose 3,5-epimerase [Erysipelothrix larvae]AMC94017.1 dTDP-4-dehydrorhamnose 3,5-epimerase [Erysipelothrix larvae]